MNNEYDGSMSMAVTLWSDLRVEGKWSQLNWILPSPD